MATEKEPALYLAFITFSFSSTLFIYSFFQVMSFLQCCQCLELLTQLDLFVTFPLLPFYDSYNVAGTLIRSRMQFQVFDMLSLKLSVFVAHWRHFEKFRAVISICSCTKKEYRSLRMPSATKLHASQHNSQAKGIPYPD